MTAQETISGARIVPVLYRLTRLDFEGGATNAEDGSHEGSLAVACSYEGSLPQKDGEMLFGASVTVEVSPTSGQGFYTLKVSESGLFRPLPEVSAEDVENEVMTMGVESIYARIRQLASDLTRSGAYGDLSLPLIRFISPIRFE